MIDTREIRQAEVGSDPDLSPAEKETTLTAPTDLDRCRIHTEIPTHIRWVLSVEESEITDFRAVDGAVVSVTATIPKGLVSLKSTSRSTDQDAGMVTRGGLR
jgi:hypothetical protein